MQKFTGQWLGLGLWGRLPIICTAKIVYHMHAKTAYYMHAKHVHSYARQSQFLHINTTSFSFICLYYLYAFSWDWAKKFEAGNCFSNIF